jgi:hypothetical protein
LQCHRAKVANQPEREELRRADAVGLDNMSEEIMKKVLVASVLIAMSGTAFAQTTGPAGQSNNADKPGMSGSTSAGSTGPMSPGTTGSNAGRDNPNGSAGAAPKAHGGPSGGDASQKETPKR